MSVDLCSNLLLTDARCLLITYTLGVQCDIVNFARGNVSRSIGISRYTCFTQAKYASLGQQ